MANTKGMDRQERKQIKRKARKNLKALYNGLNREQRAKFNDEENKKGIKAFVKTLQPEKTE